MTRQTLSVTVQKHLPAIDIDVDFVAATGRLAIFGPSGAGKTTILKTIAGLARSDRGLVRLGDDTWEDTDQKRHLPAHMRRAAFVFQDDRLFPHLSVRKNIEFGTIEDHPPTLSQFLEVSGIDALQDRSVHTLSGGERKRVAIARALAASPRLLLLDEPYAGLDRATTRQLRRELRLLLDDIGLPQILVSHHLDDVLSHADEIALVDRGKLVGFGAPEAVFTQSEGTRLIGDADETFSGGPLTILRARHAKASSVEGLEAWELKNGRHLLLAGSSAQTTSQSFIRIKGSDVSLALEAPGDTSILNVLPGTIERLEASFGFVNARVDLGSGVFLTARITAYSASRLNLVPGTPVHAMIKSAALTH